MRLAKLDLIRYGKFEDAPLEMPRATPDFHLIVGPNEAGKSTVRNAVADLLFGMPRTSVFGFRHPLSELRVGGVLEGDAGTLAFHRSRARNSLRSPTDAQLSDNALVPFLGATERVFFSQMFGLDHEQLVEGGQSILDASGNAGQVLFQSAAGIATLGGVRNSLANEADRLWSPRKSADREYYKALAALDAADRDLRESTVRAREWSEARAALEAATERCASVTASQRELETKRSSLERIRRLAPAAQTLRLHSAELDALGLGPDLPPDALRTLVEGQKTLAVAEERVKQRGNEVERLQSELDGIEYDGALLQHQRDIDALEAFRHRVQNHSSDLLRRQSEIDVRLKQLQAHCAQLGWPADEESIRALLPSAIVMRPLQELIKTRGAIELAVQAGRRGVVEKQHEVEALDAELVTMPELEVPDALRAAVTESQALRNTVSTQQRLLSSVQAAERGLADSLAALGRWARPIDELKTMTLPASARLTTLQTRRTQLEAEVRACQQRLGDALVVEDDARLAVTQFEAASRIVTSDEVRASRVIRDESWGRIKRGRTSIPEGSAELDSQIALADQLVDAQVGSTENAAQLQERRQRLEREASQVSRLRVALEGKQRELRSFDDSWNSDATASGLEAMVLEDASAWLTRREAAIAASAALEDRRNELLAERTAADAAFATLSQCLEEAGRTIEGPLSKVREGAEQLIQDADAGRERRKALVRQLGQFHRALDGLRVEAEEAKAAEVQWASQWTVALVAAGLEKAVSTPAAAEAALDLVARVREALNEIETTRRDRIDTMNRDLAEFAEQAQALATTVDPLAGKMVDAAQFSKQIVNQFRLVSAAHERRLATEKHLAKARLDQQSAQADLDETLAGLRPILKAAGMELLVDAIPVVERSDRRRHLRDAIEAARAMIVGGSDGLGLESALAEIDAADVATIPGQLAALAAEQLNVQQQGNAATEEKLRAQQALGGISGGAAAATAEARRHEALAAMADATERYLKVATASRLLRWAIERYRDRKQGPMLTRAGEIFSALTMSRYRRLVVESEKEPPTLAAQRVSGEIVPVAGLSEGTRDQMFLALRLAALDIHLAQTTALPFIADDLFVNFDDDRAKAGLLALRDLSMKTQVVFLTHHRHLLALVREVFGVEVNVLELVA